MITRPSFFQQAGVAVAAAGAPALLAGTTQAQPAAGKPRNTFRLGMAGNNFKHFTLDQALEMMMKVDVHYLCIKVFHLPLTSTNEEIAAFHAKCRSFGVTGYGAGPIYMGSVEEVNQAFAYAKRVGVKTLVGVPYSGLCSLEHEKDMENPLLGIAESVGYFRGLMDAPY